MYVSRDEQEYRQTYVESYRNIDDPTSHFSYELYLLTYYNLLTDEQQVLELSVLTISRQDDTRATL